MGRAFRYTGVPKDPFGLWQTLHSNPRHGFYLGPTAPSAESHAYFSIAEPLRLISSVPQLRSSLKKDEGAFPRFVGFFGFDAGRAFDPGIAKIPSKPNPLKTPDVYFGDYPAIVKVDFTANETILYVRESADAASQTIRRFEKAFLSPLTGNQIKKRGAVPVFDVASRQKFSAMVKRAQEHIARGDIYQANLSLRFTAAFKGDPGDLYRELGRMNPSPYACLLKFGPSWIVSTSPELLLKADGAHVATRPIAGTRPRGKNKGLDRRRQGQLLLSPKERAEHIMLVDLERNDLGRVCRAGTVRVKERFTVERYSHVMHIVSHVEGVLARGKTSLDAVASLFPGGTITGCPKISSIDIIEDIERVSRGPFYGSAGFFCDNGDAVFNILIRTALIQQGKIRLQAGAGIVADSRASREYDEVMAKARAVIEAARRTA